MAASDQAAAPTDELLDAANTPRAANTDLIEQLGLLDDAVFEAIAGLPGAMDRLRSLWPAVQAAVGTALVEESRDQYVRHALIVWRACIEGTELRDPAHAIAAIDVVSLLFDE